LPDSLFSQIESRVEQEANGSDLDVNLDVHIAVAEHLLPARTVGVIVVKADGFEVARVLVFLAQTVVHADQNDRVQVHLVRQLQELEQHPAPARSTDIDNLPGALSEKVSSRLWVVFGSQLAVEVGQRLLRIADQ